MGLEAAHPKPRLSQPGEGHKVHPYLLTVRGKGIQALGTAPPGSYSQLAKEEPFGLAGMHEPFYYVERMLCARS